MTSSYFRVVRAGVLASVLVAAALVSAQTQPAGRDTSAASVASYAPDAADAGRSGGRRRHAAERPALLRAPEREAGPPRRAAPGRQGRVGARRRRPAGAGALRRAHAVRGHAELSGAGHQRVPGVARPGHRRGRERADELRRHAVHAARADRCRPACSIARCSCSKDWAQARHVRPGAPSSASAASSSRSGGMHLGAGERTRDKIRRVQLEGSRYADRPPIGEPEVIERAQREQLMRFYRDWYRPDLMAVIVVGDVDRDAVVGDDQDALLVADQSVAGAAAAGLRRARASGHALRRRHRQGNDRDVGRHQRPAAGAPPGIRSAAIATS